jgi:hypothetical protein
MRRRLLLALAFALVAQTAAAQTNITATDPSNGQRTQVGDMGSHAIRTFLVNSVGNPFGTSSNPIRVDPTGTTPQPVTLSATATVQGTIGATQGTAAARSGRWPVFITDGTNDMPTGDSSLRSVHTTIDNANVPTNLAQRGGVALSSPDTNGFPPDGMAATALVNAGWVPKYVASAASTNSAFIKNAPGNVGGVFVQSTSATIMYVRFYDSASAPSCNSSTNFVGTVAVWPSNGTNGFMVPAGFQMLNGIAYCITGGPANNDNTAATVGGLIWFLIK